MNILALVPFILLGIGLFWALWLIFKRDFLSQNLGKVVTYFIGVVITFWVILWLVGQFLPWWTSELLENTRGSEEVQSIQNSFTESVQLILVYFVWWLCEVIYQALNLPPLQPTND